MANLTGLTDEEIGPEAADARRAHEEYRAVMRQNEKTVEVHVRPPDNPMIQERRLGKFRVSDLTFDKLSQKALLSFMSNFLIIRAEHRFDHSGFEYIAYSPLFEPADPAKYPPIYWVQSDIDGENVCAIRQDR